MSIVFKFPPVLVSKRDPSGIKFRTLLSRHFYANAKRPVIMIKKVIQDVKFVLIGFSPRYYKEFNCSFINSPAADSK